MGKFIINGGNRLVGSVKIQGSKNSVLPIYAACILCEGTVALSNVPNLTDVEVMGNILECLGAKVTRLGEYVHIDSENINRSEIIDPMASELRSSIFLLGSMLGRMKKATVGFPGGCDIGVRAIDIHIKALKEMNVVVKVDSSGISCDAQNIRPADVIFDYPSVGATENIMLAAATLKGRTTITNAAREPEIVDLQNFLNKMGAKIRGAGTSYIVIDGVSKLRGVEYSVMGDRIVAGTMAIAAAITGGELELNGCRWDLIGALLAKLDKTSCNIKRINDSIIISARKRREAIEYIETQPYPGFPTDLQAPVMSLQAVSYGVSVITENIFENRFKHVTELIKMGAQIKIKGRSAIIRGIPRLQGAEVKAQDLRGGASLILAGLNAEGQTIVNEISHIERGYESIDNILLALGADIRKEDTPEK